MTIPASPAAPLRPSPSPRPARPGSSRPRGAGRGVVAMTVVGSSVAASHALIHAPLFAAQAIRYAVAVPVLIVLARSARAPVVRPQGREWFWLAGVAALGLVLFNVAIVRGVAHAQPAAIAVALAMVPVVLGVAGPLLERQRPSRPILLAAVVVTAGSVLVEGAGRAGPAGIAWAAVALACESAFTLLAVPVLPRHGAWGVSVHSVWLGTIMLIVLSVVTEGPAAAARLTAAEWAAIAYLAVMVTAVAFVLWYSTVAVLGPGPAGLLTGIAPVSAALTGIITGSQVPGPLVWLGMLVVIGGLVTGLRPLSQEGELPACSATTTRSPGNSRRSALA
jgi:drug/metabolite transporter (DMT)-like permease